MAHATTVTALYRLLVRPLLFLLPAETAHRIAAMFLALLQRSVRLRRLFAALPAPEAIAVHALGQRFASPLGMAAGFDKSASLYNALGALGFAFVEVGTMTARAQPGNPRPRLFRLRADRALINRMGFNNPGAASAARAMARRAPDGVILGANIGKSKVTPLEGAAGDYAESARALSSLASYVVVNVSSPNTPGLRSLQSIEALREIVVAVQAEIGTRPLLVKIAPDLADDDIDAIADLALELRLAGLIAVNTTVGRGDLGLRTPRRAVAALGAGGLSGPPLRARTLAVIRRLYRRTAGSLTLIAVGGIESAEDAWQAVRAGATLIQVYTAFVFHGPGLPTQIVEGLHAKLVANGFANIQDAIGSEHARESPLVVNQERVSGVQSRR